MFKRILIPLDGSLLAEQALEPALRLAQSALGELILMRVPIYADSYALGHPTPNPVGDPARDSGVTASPPASAAEYLRNIREANVRPNLALRTILGEGDRAGAIVDAALSEQVNLIVMSTHGRTGISRWVFGSVTSRVLSHAPCPVLIFHRPCSIKHILITLDGSLLAEQALEPGLALANVFDSKVTLLRVLPGPDVGAGQTTSLYESSDCTASLQEEKPNAQAQRYLHDLIAIQETDRVEVSGMVISGQVATSILDFAADQNADLIAMTTHGRTGLRRWVYGSVTEKVLYSSGRAILVVRPPEH
jgi:nucleotide-binding universal stress UspA family protein